MPKRRRHASPNSAHAETEVWPAYVDVLAAAFVFVLLAFAALLTRDVADEEQRLELEGRSQQDLAEFGRQFQQWLQDGQAAVNEAAVGMASELTPVNLAASCTLPDANQLGMNPTLVASFSEKQVELDPQRRHPVTLICTFSEERLRFEPGDVRPDERSRRVAVPKLAEMAKKIVGRRCGPQTNSSAWCASGLEVVGHTDCRPLPTDERTNWELSSDRADWVLRQMIGELGDLPKAQKDFRIGASGRADREPRADTSAICAAPDRLQRYLLTTLSGLRDAAESDLTQNRRVEVHVYLRTKPLAERPKPPQVPRP